MSVLTLLRHGQASFGDARYDALSELGIAQARATGAWLRERRNLPGIVYSGPRRRQADTARHLLEGAGVPLPIEVVGGLDEFAEGEEVLGAAAALFGRPMTGPSAPPRAEQLRCYDAAYVAWARARIEIPGRAGFGDFRAAVRHWLREILAMPSRPSGAHILAVTSAGVVCAAVCEVLGLPDEHWHALVRVIQNASVTEFVFSTGRCSLRTFNSTGHLPVELMSAI